MKSPVYGFKRRLLICQMQLSKPIPEYSYLCTKGMYRSLLCVYARLDLIIEREMLKPPLYVLQAGEVRGREGSALYVISSCLQESNYPRQGFKILISSYLTINSKVG
jgi:hypothetical protein